MRFRDTLIRGRKALLGLVRHDQFEAVGAEKLKDKGI